MPDLSLGKKLQNIGAFFILTKEGPFVVVPEGFGRVHSMARLRNETNESIKRQFGDLPIIKENLSVEVTQDNLAKLGAPSDGRGIGVAGSFRSSADGSGDIRNIQDLDVGYVQPVFQNIENALKTTPNGEKVAVGNEDYSRAKLEEITGQRVAFSEAAVEEQRKRGEAEAARKDAEVAAAQQPQTQAERAGRIPTVIFDSGGGFSILDSRIATPEKIQEWKRLISEGKAGQVKFPEGSELEWLPYGDPEKEPVIGTKDVTLAAALARQNQISTGSTPQLSGRPDLFAIQPTQAEIDAGIKPIVPQAGMAPVDPMVAAAEDISSLQSGDLPTPAAEAASGLNPEEDAAADALADAAANSDLIYNPQVSKEDIDRYVAEGLENAKIELDPYYSEIIGRAKEAYLQGVLFETQARELQLRQEELTRQQEKKTAVSDLEARGATFSGEAAELLGEESALPPELQSVVQGLLQKQQSLVASSTRQRFEQNMATLSQQAEELLGTQTVQQLTEQTGNVNPLTAGLFRLFKTSTPGSIAREKETQVQTRGRELAQADIARELAASPEFPTEKILDYI